MHIWRRSYDMAPPGGESLKDTGARVWPYYLHDMQPHVLRGEHVLVAAHGNSLRALIMALEGLTPSRSSSSSSAPACRSSTASMPIRPSRRSSILRRNSVSSREPPKAAIRDPSSGSGPLACCVMDPGSRFARPG